ncbi:MAG: hypothetical protein AAF063_22455 [Cyanobacteria bacterium J06643_5]
MIIISYMNFLIKIKHSPYQDWIANVYDSSGKKIVVNNLSTQQQAENWSKYIIENISFASFLNNCAIT